ncbi:MAG: homoserine kinase [Aureispira sp.]|nr:homoserine kinase [Aureispira sp.]
MIWTLEEIKKVLDRYDHGDVLSVERMSKGFANINYKVVCVQQTVLFKNYFDNNPTQINYEIKVLQKLKKSGIPCATPLSNSNGKYLEKTDKGIVILYEFIEGEEPELNTNNVAEIAKAMAQMHNIQDLEELVHTNQYSLDFGLQVLAQYPHKKEEFPEICSYVESEMKHLDEAIKIPLPKGIVHCDIFTDNTLFRNGKLLAILDFETVCTDHCLIDIGTAVNGFCYVNNELDTQLLEVLLEHYQKVRRLELLEKELVYYYIRWGIYTIVSWHLSRLFASFTENRHYRVQELISRVKILDEKKEVLEGLIKRI